MKKIHLFIGLILVSLLAISCSKSDNQAIKNSKLEIAVKSATQASASFKSVASVPTFALSSFKICIADVLVEENSGNNIEQEGEFEDGSTDMDNEELDGKSGNDLEQEGNFDDGENDESDSKNEDDEIFLPGPFTIDVINGEASLGEMDVFPGTFKKVEFSFAPSDSADLIGHSIVITGTYTAIDGTLVPVTLKSAFNQQVEVAVANGGISVKANNKATISIVLDAQTWMEGIDFSAATLSNGEIIIDEFNNTEILSDFNVLLLSLVEVED